MVRACRAATSFRTTGAIVQLSNVMLQCHNDKVCQAGTAAADLDSYCQCLWLSLLLSAVSPLLSLLLLLLFVIVITIVFVTCFVYC